MSPRTALALAPALVGLLLAGCGPAAAPAAPAGPPSSRPASPPDERAFWKGRDDLIKPPATVKGEALRTPGLQRLKLGNGIEVVLLPDHTLPLVELMVLVRTGAIDDPPGEVGLAEFTTGMLRQGTRRLDADQISQTVDGAGVSLGASSEYELSGLSCSGRSQELDLCLEMLSDLLIRPTFPAKEMDEIRDRLLSAIKETRDDPASLAEQHFNNLLYGDGHPAGRPMTAATVQRITRKALVDFHRRHFVPGNVLVGVSGDIDPPALRARLEKAFGTFAGPAPTRTPIVPAQPPPPGLQVLLVDKPDLSQSFFAVGHTGIRRTDPEREAVLVANYVLGGGGFSSRLMKVVRAEGGKTYGIRSQFDEGMLDGSFVIQSFTRNNQLVSMLQMTRKELGRLSSEPPNADELRFAKGDLAGGFGLRMQTRAGVVMRLLRAQAFGLPGTFVTEFPVRVERLLAAQVAAAARRHLGAERLIGAVVGKAQVVAPLLKAAGISFQQVSYLDPISAAERARGSQPEAEVRISPAEMKRARPFLEKMLRTAGGRERLSLLRSLRLSGPGQVEEPKTDDVKGTYSLTLRLPDELRVVFDFKVGAIVQVLAGKRAFVQAGRERRPLPDEVRQRMQGMIWRDPVLLPLHALAEGMRYRLSSDPELGKRRGSVAIELHPPGLPPTTILVERRSGKLLEIRHQGRSGQLRLVELSQHRLVPGGVLVPHRLVEVTGKRRQVVDVASVELNAKVTPEEILDGPRLKGGER